MKFLTAYSVLSEWSVKKLHTRIKMLFYFVGRYTHLIQEHHNTFNYWGSLTWFNYYKVNGNI